MSWKKQNKKKRYVWDSRPKNGLWEKSIYGLFIYLFFLDVIDSHDIFYDFENWQSIMCLILRKSSSI